MASRIWPALTLLLWAAPAASQQLLEETQGVGGRTLELTFAVMPLLDRMQDLRFTIADLGGKPKDLQVKETNTDIRIELAADVLFDFDKADIRPTAAAALDQTATITCSSGGLASQNVSVTATDVGGAGIPTATISKPLDGDRVSGASADFFGQGSISGGGPPTPTLTKADFYIDGVLGSTDPFVPATGHFHFNGSHNSWNTTGLSDGVHVLRMVVTASSGATGSDQNLCVVANGPAYSPTAGGDNLVVIEADRYHQRVGGSGAAAGHAWTPTTAFAGQSGSYALQAAPNDDLANINTGYAAISPRLDYMVNFAATGTYYVWVRGWGPDAASDSCHVGLDGLEIATSDRITGFTPGWTWSNQTMDGVVASFTVSVVGFHCVSIWMREDGFVFDKMVLTTNAGLAAPSGAGPAVTAGAPAVVSTGGGVVAKGGGGGGGCGLAGLEGLALLAILRGFRRRRC